MSVVYVPRTMIGRAALAAWSNIGKHLTPLDEAVRILRAARTPDMELIRRVALEIGQDPAMVDTCWCRVMDAMLAEERREEQALLEFDKTLDRDP